jgi:glucose-6-phosphate-specific signal transduction histidine kinase
MMIYEGIKEIEAERTEHIATAVPLNKVVQTVARLLTDITGQRLTTKRTSAMLYKTLMFNKGTPINNSIDELENNTSSLASKVKEMLKEAEPFYFVYGTPIFKEINDFITTLTMQYYLVSVLRDGSLYTIKIAKVKHYKAEEGRKGYGKILM